MPPEKIKGLEFTYKVTGSADVLTSGLKGTVNALDGAMDFQKGMDAADTVLGAGRTTEAFGDLADAAGNAGKALDRAANVGKILDGSGSMKYLDDIAGPGAKAVDNYANGGKIADSIGDAASSVNKALNGADGLKAADTAKYWNDAMDQAAGAERYVYRGKDVSPDLTVSTRVVDDAGNVIDAYEALGKANLNNINDFVNGNKLFDEVLDDYAIIYSENISNNKMWSWDNSIPGGDSLTAKQKQMIKQTAISSGYIPDIKVTKVDGLRYGFADFEGANVVKETVQLPEEMWLLSDEKQFEWLDKQINGHVDGYTWHHSEVPGKMQLVPFGIHNITSHNGGRTVGMWAYALR